MNNSKLIIASVVVVIILVGTSIALSEENTALPIQERKVEQQTAFVDEANIVLGELESKHEHMTMLVFIDGEPVDFNQDRYMLKDEYTHFENDDGIVVHKHARGVTLPYFFSTLGIDLTQDCITFDTGRQYCDSPTQGKTLRVIIDGDEVKNLDAYELRHQDKILINYGNDDETELRFKLNSVPNVPLELL